MDAPEAPYLAPPSGLPDVTIEVSTSIPPGGERLSCVYAALPNDRGVIAVPSAESHYTPGSHHLLAYRTSLRSIPFGRTGVFDCEFGAFMVNVTGSYYEAQQPDSRRDLPPGVAHRFEPGEIVVLETHYLNATDQTLDAHATLIMHTTQLENVPNEAGSIMFDDFDISIPAGRRARATKTCTLANDFNPILLWSHMHKQGMTFVATTDDPEGAAQLGTLYASAQWEAPQPRAYPSSPPVTLHKGTHITFACDFENPTTRTIVFGQSAQTNEMCILHGMYWPRMPRGEESCAIGPTTMMAIP